MRVLVVEDTLDVGEAVVASLQRMGLEVDWAQTAEDAELFVAANTYVLLVLDVMLPGKSGFELLRDFRKNGATTPVLILTARSNVDDRVTGLDRGADDYLTKPFDFREFEARARALLRRNYSARTEYLTIGNVNIDLAERRVTVANHPVELTRRELALLETLMRRPGKVFSKRELLDRLFTIDEDVGENAIELYIARLRRKLVGAEPGIRTLRGQGYRMEGRPNG